MRKSAPLARMLAVVCATIASTMASPVTSPLSAQSAAAYNPLAVAGASARAPLDLDVIDTKRKRTIPIRVYRPDSRQPAPVLLFSHGLGGARTNNAYLGEHWSARGYVVVYLQHPGSDESVWQNARPMQRMAAMRRAANTQNFLLRVQDVPAVLDALTAWHGQPGHPLSGVIDMSRVGMSGHSFGAVTTQAVAGQALPNNRTPYLDARIDAAVIMSPSVPKNVPAQVAFGGVQMPWLLMTGTEDGSPIGNTTVDDRLAVYPALPTGNKFELVLHNAEHSAFGDRALPGERQGARNPNHHRAILALSTAFWDAYVRQDAAALAWIRSSAPSSVLEPMDRWQRK